MSNLIDSRDVATRLSPKRDIQQEQLIDLTPVKVSLLDLTPTKPERDLRSSNIDLLGLEISPAIKKPINEMIKESSPFDGALSIDDLVSEPADYTSPQHNSAVPKLDLSSSANKPPRKRSLDSSDMHQITPDKDENNRSFNENSMSMSFRRANAEHIISSAISDIIGKHLGLSRPKVTKKPKEKESKPSIPTFDQFLHDLSKRNTKDEIPVKNISRFSPIVKTVNMEKIYQDDEILQILNLREKSALNELQELEKEKLAILSSL